MDWDEVQLGIYMFGPLIGTIFISTVLYLLKITEIKTDVVIGMLFLCSFVWTLKQIIDNGPNI